MMRKSFQTLLFGQMTTQVFVRKSTMPTSGSSMGSNPITWNLNTSTGWNARRGLPKSSPRGMSRGSEGLRPTRATPPTQAWSPSELGWSTGKASKVS